MTVARSCADPDAATFVGHGSLTNLDPNVVYTLSVWTMDQAGWLSGTAAIYSWKVVDRPPVVRVLSGPSKASSLLRPTFHLVAVVRCRARPEPRVPAVPDALCRAHGPVVYAGHSPPPPTHTCAWGQLCTSMIMYDFSVVRLLRVACWWLGAFSGLVRPMRP